MKSTTRNHPKRSNISKTWFVKDHTYHVTCLTPLQDSSQRFERLQTLLDKSQKYSEILYKQMSLVKARSKVSIEPKKKGGRGRPPKGRGKGGEAHPKKLKMRVESDEEDSKADVKEEFEESFQQSSLITGGTLKSYQLEGVAWMATLWENGISGILGELGVLLESLAEADKMILF